MTSAQNRSGSLLFICAAVYLLIVAALIFQVRSRTGGHFVYPLDDPYIHLALAEQLAHGHYGINAADFSSPSSSALWPLLLVPFSTSTWHVYLPLILNIFFGLIATSLIAKTVDRRLRTSLPKKFTIALLLMAAANLFSLTLLGMEHVLQITLSIACTIGIMEALDGNDIPTWCLIAAALGPAVRYENLSITLAICIALFARGRRGKAVTVFLASLIPPIVFGLFLKHLGLPFLPNSVLVKARLFTGHTGVIVHALWTVLTATYLFFHEAIRWPMALLALVLLSAFFIERDRTRRNIYIGTALVPVLQLLIGRFGWFHRYEVFAVIFSSLIALHLYANRPRVSFNCLAIALVAMAAPYFLAIAHTATGSSEVYRQQYQTARFVHDIYRHNVAVDDLGLISFRPPLGLYILDIYGLGSAEAAQHADKEAPWLDDITRRYNANLAMIYPEFFHIPSDWLPLAELCLSADPVVISRRCVVFYSTSTREREQLRAQLRQFAPTLPPGTTLRLDPASLSKSSPPHQ